MSSMSTNTSVTEGGGCSTFVSASRTSRSSASCQALACSRPVSRSNASPTATLIPASVDAGMLDLTQRSDIPPTRDLDLGEPAARAVVLAARRVKHQLGISERRFWLYHPGFGPLAQLVEQGTFNPKVAGSIPARPIASESNREALPQATQRARELTKALTTRRIPRSPPVLEPDGPLNRPGYVELVPHRMTAGSTLSQQLHTWVVDVWSMSGRDGRRLPRLDPRRARRPCAGRSLERCIRCRAARDPSRR